MTNLVGKKCVVTAAAQGIGRAAAERLVGAGAQVYGLDINADALTTLSGVEARQLDVTDGWQVERLASEIGTTDVLFNCAGIVHSGSVLECPEEDWDFAFELNVKSMYRMVRAFLPGMLAAGSGSIINMSSVASSVKGVPNRCAYSASKAAVIGFTKSIATDYVGQGIRCNAICPGTVDSPSLHDRLSATGDYDMAMAEFIARQPMGRIGRAEEVAALVVYLASDDASFTTGQAHVIDGGWAT